MPRPGQEVLERSSIIVTADFVEARFTVGLPAQGRRILGRQASAMLCQQIPKITETGLKYENLDKQSLTAHLNIAEDADTLRQQLTSLGLVAFVADGSILPRRSGVDDRPMLDRQVVDFVSPPSLRVEVNLPYAGTIAGMGLPAGVTLIVGGGYHGKSTLLAAIERGVYNHIPDDGRSLVVTNQTAVKIRAEDGRRVEKVDLRPFINNLPNQIDTTTFQTGNASGSTSQAANIIEALEVGSQVLLLDEDTCATNLMIRDARMQRLVEAAGEPITPFIDRVRYLANERQVSSIMVFGGSGDYFDVADTVIRMDNYRPKDVTAEAKRVAQQQPTRRKIEAARPWPEPTRRVPVAASLNPGKGKRKINIKAHALRSIQFGTEEIDIQAIAQLVDHGQARAIGQALNLAREHFIGNNDDSITQIVNKVMAHLRDNGLDALDHRQVGDYVAFRGYEFAATLNRLRSLIIKSGANKT